MRERHGTLMLNIVNRTSSPVHGRVQLNGVMMQLFSNTPVDDFGFANRHIYLKRDDLLHEAFSGNKARKFAYFLEHDFSGITRVISYGSAQANSLYSLSVLAKLKGWQCDFYVNHIAKHIHANPCGNYAAALDNGVNIIDLSHNAAYQAALVENPDLNSHDFIEHYILPHDNAALFIPEGGRCHFAEYGLNRLASEIEQWALARSIDDLKVFLPSGTGTTAVYLNRYFIQQQTDIRVVTCAVVGGDDYLRWQFSMLNPILSEHPEIVNVGKKYHFGKIYREFYDMWQHINQGDIRFELLYDPLGFIALEHYLVSNPEANILYLHQGGLLGNETMLPRYQRKFLENT